VRCSIVRRTNSAVRRRRRGRSADTNTHGLHAAGLVRDGGTLKIRHRAVGDALAQGLVVRHRETRNSLR